jgi:hypothetical protein
MHDIALHGFVGSGWNVWGLIGGLIIYRLLIRLYIVKYGSWWWFSYIGVVSWLLFRVL